MLYEALERFKDFRRLCPHHGLQHWMIIQAFYNSGMNLDDKTEDKPYNLIEEMALNNFLWSTKQGQPKQVGDKLEVDVLDFAFY